MLPFTIELEYGGPIYEQMLAAVRRALFTGEIRDGDPFPSVRVLSQELRVSPTTAHKVVDMLKKEGLLAPRPGIGMVVTANNLPDRGRRKSMIVETARKLVRESKDLSLRLNDVQETVREEWNHHDNQESS